MILQKLKRDAEAKVGEKITEAVITTFRHFDIHRESDKGRRRIAGFNVRRIINEPTAAASRMDLIKRSEQITVFDFGGGTFDVTVLEVSAVST